MNHTDVTAQPVELALAMSSWTYAEQDSIP